MYYITSTRVDIDPKYASMGSKYVSNVQGKMRRLLGRIPSALLRTTTTKIAETATHARPGPFKRISVNTGEQPFCVLSVLPSPLLCHICEFCSLHTAS